MRELMRKQACEKQHCGNDSRSPGNGVAPIRINRLEMRCQRKGNESSDNQPAVVQAKFDSEDPPEFDLIAQCASRWFDCPVQTGSCHLRDPRSTRFWRAGTL